MTTGNRFLRNISFSTLQMIINQGFGLVVFYILSRQLDKTTFGNFNFALAILLTSFGILSCGLDQLVVKKIAWGENLSSILSLYLFHTVLAVGFFYLVLLSFVFLAPFYFNSHYLLLYLSLGKLFNFFSMPFKQLSAGLEKFRALMWMSIGSSVVRGLFLSIAFAADVLTIKSILIIFIAADFIELLISILISRSYLETPLFLDLNLQKYKKLFEEALPQLATVILSAVIARMDWILIGIFLSALKLGEYSFAYKAFEVSTFPLLIVAPILIPLFSKIFKAKLPDPAKLVQLKILLSVELAIASLTAIILAIVWVPVVDFISDGKYGAVNQKTIFFLSLCIPFLYFNNFMWTVNFTMSKLKMIMYVFVATFIINAVADLVLIPLLENEGAAIAYFLALIAQSMYFLRRTKIIGFDGLTSILFGFPSCALVSGMIATFFFNNILLVLITSIGIYIAAISFVFYGRIGKIQTLRSAFES
jgi:O-antigen/teichoic acid export membrane protein